MKGASSCTLAQPGSGGFQAQTRFDGHPDRRRGILLPVVLLLVLALAAASTSILVLVSTERLVARGELRFLEERIHAEKLLNDAAQLALIPGFDRAETDLTGDFILVEVTPPTHGPSYFSVQWVFNPESIAAGLPGAVEATGPPPESGVQRLPGCPSADTRPLIVSPAQSLSDPTDPDGAGRPHLGILGITELWNLTETELPGVAVLPGAVPPAVRRAVDGTVIRSGRGSGVLVAAGDLLLEGSAQFSGLLVVEGELTLRGSARVARASLGARTRHYLG